MQIIEPSAKVLDTTHMTPFQIIETVGRTCYKSEDKITEASAEKFVQDIIKRQHFAMTEHFWPHLILPNTNEQDFLDDLHVLATSAEKSSSDIELTRFLNVSILGDIVYVSAPLRVFLEWDAYLSAGNKTIAQGSIIDLMSCLSNNLPGVFQFPAGLGVRQKCLFVTREQMKREIIAKFEELPTLHDFYDQRHELMKHMEHTVHFVCDRGVSHELVRHRPASFGQESTRYCNYSKEKFGGEVTYIMPFFFDDPNPPDLTEEQFSERYGAWADTMRTCERNYLRILNDGGTPQEARTVLPNSLKTEVMMTTNELEWQHVIDLRYLAKTGAPHPQMKQVMSLCVKDLSAASEGRLVIG